MATLRRYQMLVPLSWPQNQEMAQQHRGGKYGRGVMGEAMVQKNPMLWLQRADDSKEQHSDNSNNCVSTV
eukprot:13101509-Ditylum_brightwellii.AAC.1